MCLPIYVHKIIQLGVDAYVCVTRPAKWTKYAEHLFAKTSLYTSKYLKIVNFKKENRDPEKLPKQGEDSESL